MIKQKITSSNQISKQASYDTVRLKKSEVVCYCGVISLF